MSHWWTIQHDALRLHHSEGAVVIQALSNDRGIDIYI